MKIDRENKKIAIVSMIGGTASLLFLIFFIYPLYNNLRAYSEELVEVRTNIFLTHERIEAAEQTRSLYNSISSDFWKIERLFIDSAVPVEFIEFLEKTSTENNLGINISPFSIRKGEKDYWEPVGFQLNVSGDYAGFRRFMEKLEKAPYALEVNNLLLRRASDAPGDMTANLTLKVYSR